MNEHFELVFGIVYSVIIFAIFVAIIFQIHYWILSDSPTSRNLVPISFLIGQFKKNNKFIDVPQLIRLLDVYASEQTPPPLLRSYIGAKLCSKMPLVFLVFCVLCNKQKV